LISLAGQPDRAGQFSLSGINLLKIQCLQPDKNSCPADLLSGYKT